MSAPMSEWRERPCGLASMRVLEKNGFVREGVLKNAIVKTTEPWDEVLYATFPSDHRSR
jgi:RimJ/RimL family protein N-acetyltransferase